MFFLACLSILLLFIVIPLFSVFVQTIKNLIHFVLIIIAVSLGLMTTFGLEFFPIFFILIYVGAIIVTTLFMVLTFDLKNEYNKKLFSNKALFNICLYFFVSPALYFFGANYGLFFSAGRLNSLDKIYFFNKCVTTYGGDEAFCRKHFGELAHDNGFYAALVEQTSDVSVLANNLYTTYSLLFLILGVILTLALFSALTLVKVKIAKN